MDTLPKEATSQSTAPRRLRRPTGMSPMSKRSHGPDLLVPWSESESLACSGNYVGGRRHVLRCGDDCGSVGVPPLVPLAVAGCVVCGVWDDCGSSSGTFRVYEHTANRSTVYVN